MCKPLPPEPLSVRQLMTMDLDARVFWGPSPGQMHAICIAALDLPAHPANMPARFTGKATITSDGHIMCNFICHDGVLQMGAHAGTIRQLVNYVDGLAIPLQLTDAMDLELRRALDAWIATSYEPTPTRFAPCVI